MVVTVFVQSLMIGMNPLKSKQRERKSKVAIVKEIINLLKRGFIMLFLGLGMVFLGLAFMIDRTIASIIIEKIKEKGFTFGVRT